MLFCTRFSFIWLSPVCFGSCLSCKLQWFQLLENMAHVLLIYRAHWLGALWARWYRNSNLAGILFIEIDVRRVDVLHFIRYEAQICIWQRDKTEARSTIRFTYIHNSFLLIPAAQQRPLLIEIQWKLIFHFIIYPRGSTIYGLLFVFTGASAFFFLVNEATEYFLFRFCWFIFGIQRNRFTFAIFFIAFIIQKKWIICIKWKSKFGSTS